MPQLVRDGQDEADALAHSPREHVGIDLILIARTPGMRRGRNDHIGIGVHLFTGEPHVRDQQGPVAIQVAVDIATTVLRIPIRLALQDVAEIRIRAQRLLLAPKPALIAAGRMGERGAIQHRHIAKPGTAATMFDNHRCRIPIDHMDNSAGRGFPLRRTRRVRRGGRHRLHAHEP